MEVFICRYKLMITAYVGYHDMYTRPQSYIKVLMGEHYDNGHLVPFMRSVNHKHTLTIF
jgi:hypothetical protein